MAAARAVAWRSFEDARIRNGSFGVLFALYALANAAGYRHTYPTLRDRVEFAQSFGANKTVQLFYGVPHDLLTVGGYAAWRVGGVASIAAAAWSLLAVVKATRAEETAGRQELVLAGTLTRRTAYAAALAAISAGATLLWLGLFLGLVAGRLPVSGSAYLALAAVAPIPVFVGVGALAAQLASSRRLALELGGGVLVLAFLLRVVADTSSGLGWVRWGTPLGWSEELRAFAEPRPAVLVLPAVVSVLLLGVAGWIASSRDIGSGLLHGRDSRPPRIALLSSPTAFALRGEVGSLLAWLVGAGAYALVIGLLSTSFTASNIPENVREELAKLGVSIATPAGALGVYFLLFVFAVSLFACAQIGAARHEEAEQRLETLFATMVGRRRWLGGRLLLAGAEAALIALAAGILAWVGAASQGARVPLSRMLEAGVNCLPTALFFLGAGALAFALLPRASTGIAYGLVSITFVWQLFGALLGAPHVLLDLSPFRHVGLVPAQPFRGGAAAVLVGLAVLQMSAAAWAFRRRDLAGA